MSTEIGRDYTTQIDQIFAAQQPVQQWEEPREFSLSQEAGRHAFVNEVAARPSARVVSRIDVAAEGLFKLRHPDEIHDEDAHKVFVKQAEQGRATYGNVFYFPWLDAFVHYPEREDYYALRTTRNHNVITAEEQAELRKPTILLAGLSVGSNVANALARGGIGGKYILADPDIIDPTNLNRIEADMTHVGLRKVDVQAMRLSMLDPYAEQVHVREAVSLRNIDAMFEHEPDIIIDEVDDLRAKALLRLYAKQYKTPLIMGTDVGKVSLLDVERYDTDPSTIPFDGRLTPAQFTALLDGTMSPEEQRKLTLKIVGIRNVTARMLSSAANIGKTLSGMPQLGTTAAVTGNLTADAARDVLLSRPVKTGRSRYGNKTRGSNTSSPLAFLRALKEFQQAGK